MFAIVTKQLLYYKVYHNNTIYSVMVPRTIGHISLDINISSY